MSLAEPRRLPVEDAGVALRPFRAVDADALAALVQASLPELYPWLPWAHAGYGVDHAQAFIAHTHAGFASGGAHEFALWYQDRLVGACGLNAVDPVYLRANLGYWIASAEAGRGLVTRAVRQLIDWSFAETALERLEIIAAVGNMRSQRVAERVGAVREGVLARRVWVRSNPDLEPSPCVLDAGVLYAVVRPAQSGGAVDEAA